MPGEVAPVAIGEDGQPIEGAAAVVLIGEDGQPIVVADGAAAAPAEPEVNQMLNIIELIFL